MKQQPDLSTIAQRESFFIALYKKVFPAVAKYISKRGGSLEDANDIFQDGIIAYYEKLVSGLNIENEQAYIMGACKNLWIKKLNAAGNLSFDSVDEIQIAESGYTEPATDRLMHYLQTTGQKCMNLLKAFYYDKVSLRQIAEAFGYAGERSATVQKYKCLEKVRDTVKQQALQYEDFID